MIRTLLCAAALCAGCSTTLAESNRNYVGTLPSGIWNNCYPQTVLPWGSCDSNRGDNRNGRAGGPSVDNSPPGTPGGPNVPGGSPIPGRPGLTPTPTTGGDDPDDPPGGCVTNCGPGQGGLGNPGNDKGVGRAGENPNGRGFGPTGRRGKNN